MAFTSPAWKFIGKMASMPAASRSKTQTLQRPADVEHLLRFSMISQVLFMVNEDAQIDNCPLSIFITPSLSSLQKPKHRQPRCAGKFWDFASRAPAGSC